MAQSIGNVKTYTHKFLKKLVYFSYKYTNQEVTFSNLSSTMHDHEKFFQDHQRLHPEFC